MQTINTTLILGDNAPCCICLNMYRKTLKNPSGVIIMFPVEMVEVDPILDTPTEQT